MEMLKATEMQKAAEKLNCESMERERANASATLKMQMNDIQRQSYENRILDLNTAVKTMKMKIQTHWSQPHNANILLPIPVQQYGLQQPNVQTPLQPNVQLSYLHTHVPNMPLPPAAQFILPVQPSNRSTHVPPMYQYPPPKYCHIYKNGTPQVTAPAQISTFQQTVTPATASTSSASDSIISHNTLQDILNKVTNLEKRLNESIAASALSTRLASMEAKLEECVRTLRARPRSKLHRKYEQDKSRSKSRSKTRRWPRRRSRTRSGRDSVSRVRGHSGNRARTSSDKRSSHRSKSRVERSRLSVRSKGRSRSRGRSKSHQHSRLDPDSRHYER